MMLSLTNGGGACPECHISQGVNIITKNTTPTYPYSPAGERRYWMDQLVPDQYVLDFGDTYINTSTTCSVTFNGNIIFGINLDGSYYSDLIQKGIIEEYPEFSNQDLPRKIYFDMEGTEPMSTIFTRGGKKYLCFSSEAMADMDLFSNRGDIDIILTNIYSKFPDFRVYLDSYGNNANWG